MTGSTPQHLLHSLVTFIENNWHKFCAAYLCLHSSLFSIKKSNLPPIWAAHQRWVTMTGSTPQHPLYSFSFLSPSLQTTEINCVAHLCINYPLSFNQKGKSPLNLSRPSTVSHENQAGISWLLSDFIWVTFFLELPQSSCVGPVHWTVFNTLCGTWEQCQIYVGTTHSNL